MDSKKIERSRRFFWSEVGRVKWLLFPGIFGCYAGCSLSLVAIVLASVLQ